MRSTPLVPLPASVWAYRWGWVRGRMARRLMASICTDRPPRSSKVVFRACLGTKSPSNCFSNLLRVFSRAAKEAEEEVGEVPSWEEVEEGPRELGAPPPLAWEAEAEAEAEAETEAEEEEGEKNKYLARQ